MRRAISAGASCRILTLAGCCLFATAQADAAEPYASEWAKSLKSSARLISAGGGSAGIEIQLTPGTITYWRNPGDAGLPPVYSFDGSTNLAQAEVHFPAPMRIREGVAEAFGYEHSLILPIDVRALDPAKPVALALKLNYAVCEKICVPAQANLHLTLPAATDSPFVQPLAAARSETPRPVEWGDLKADLATQGDNRWRLCVPPEAGRARDAFIEPPELWWFAVSTQTDVAGCFSIELKQKPEGANLPVTVRVTLTGGDGPIETSMVLAP